MRDVAAATHQAYEEVRDAAIRQGLHTHEDFDRCIYHREMVQLRLIELIGAPKMEVHPVLYPAYLN